MCQARINLVNDMDLWEVKEAFPMTLMLELGLSHNIVNANGGGVGDAITRRASWAFSIRATGLFVVKL
ncbi:MAG: hypothetical protein FD135_1962 [Comamonadaceae bacterium]|nr:MAG: hypothetical protein FD135_1962 [Comamonadaceae bacterium]